MTASIFWYDFETTGIQAHIDRAIQVAGIRTNEQLEEIGEPLNLYCKLSDDILPHPISSFSHRHYAADFTRTRFNSGLLSSLSVCMSS